MLEGLLQLLHGCYKLAHNLRSSFGSGCLLFEVKEATQLLASATRLDPSEMAAELASLVGDLTHASSAQQAHEKAQAAEARATVDAMTSNARLSAFRAAKSAAMAQ